MQHAAKYTSQIKAPCQPSKLRVAGSNPAGVATSFNNLAQHAVRFSCCCMLHLFSFISADFPHFPNIPGNSVQHACNTEPPLRAAAEVKRRKQMGVVTAADRDDPSQPGP